MEILMEVWNFLSKIGVLQKIWPKVERLVKKQGLCRKIEVFDKSCNLGRKWKIFAKRHFGRKFLFVCKILVRKNFCQKSRFLSKDLSFRQKSKSWSKIENFVKNRNFGRKIPLVLQKLKFRSKIEISVKIKKIFEKKIFLSKPKITKGYVKITYLSIL